MKRLDRIIFFSKDDMGTGYMLRKTEKILKNHNDKITYDNINDVIELYQIKRYFDEDLLLDSWSEVEKERFKSIVVQYWSIINRFFAGINDNNVDSYYAKVESHYYHSFWELVDKCQSFNNISQDGFKRILTLKIWIMPILEQKNIVKHYDRVIRDFLMEHEGSAEILISKYEETRDARSKQIYLPSSLTIEDKNTILNKYLDWERANPNYMRLIITARDRKDFKIPDTIRLKAKKKEKYILDELLNDESALVIGYEVAVSKFQQDPVLSSLVNNKLSYSYGLPWIKEHRDNLSLFKNFQYLFGMIDEQDRISLVSQRREASFLDVIGVHSREEYPVNYSFRIQQTISLMQIIAYSHTLHELGIHLEQVVEDFFNDFTSSSKIDHLKILLPAQGSSFLEKIRFLLPEMESLMKKHKLYAENYSIDPELLAISSTPCGIQDLPSCVEKKYVYGVDSKVASVQHQLFSAQRMLYPSKLLDSQYRSLYELLSKENVTINEVEECQLPAYKHLISEGFLLVDHEYIKPNNTYEVAIYRNLYYKEVISYYHWSPTERDVIDKLQSQGYLEFGSTLLSKPEINYFNYYLNKSEYTNGLNLRNKYAHGTHHETELNMKSDYYRLLLLFILLVWKIINDIDLFHHLAGRTN